MVEKYFVSRIVLLIELKQKYKTPLLSEVMKNDLFKIIYIFKLVCNYTDRMIIIPILEGLLRIKKYNMDAYL